MLPTPPSIYQCPACWNYTLGTRHYVPAAAVSTDRLGLSMPSEHAASSQDSGLRTVQPSSTLIFLRIMFLCCYQHQDLRQWELQLASPRSMHIVLPLGMFALRLIETSTDHQGATALVAAELSRYKIDSAALCDTILADEGSLTEVGEGYTFFWKGLTSDFQRIRGLDFAIRV